MRQKLLGAEHPSIAKSLNNLAIIYEDQGKYEQAKIYRYQGKYEQAEEKHLQALSMRRRLLGTEHPDVANSLKNLAEVYRHQERYLEAESLYLQAVEIAEKRLGEKHPETVKYRNNLQVLRDKL